MTTIKTASANQWTQIQLLKESVLKSQTDDISFENCKETIDEIWKSMGEKTPTVFQVDGPLAMVATYSLISNADGLKGSQLSSQLYSQLRSQLYSQLRSQLYSQLDSQLSSQLYSQLYSQLRSQLDSQLQNFKNNYYISFWWRAWEGWYQGAKILGVKFDEEKLKMFNKWCGYCPIVLPFKNLCIVCKNPIKVNWQNNLLHNEFGPSVEFKDGYKIYTLEGIQVDEQIVMNPESQTIEQINSETNADIKIIRINRYAGQGKSGWPKYLDKIKAKELDCRENDIEGTIEALYETPVGANCLIATCPSGKIAPMTVHPSIRTCEQAANYLNPFGRIGLKGRIIGRT